MGDVTMIYAASLADRISEGLGEKYGRAEVSAGEAKLGSGESAVSVSLGRELYYETVSHLIPKSHFFPRLSGLRRQSGITRSTPKRLTW